jgi:hypothetical protein
MNLAVRYFSSPCLPRNRVWRRLGDMTSLWRISIIEVGIRLILAHRVISLLRERGIRGK